VYRVSDGCYRGMRDNRIRSGREESTERDSKRGRSRESETGLDWWRRLRMPAQ
jgi:hypothetical protein